MKTRIITGVTAALFAIGILVAIGFGYVRYISFIIAVLSAIAVHEVITVSKCKNKVVMAVTMLFAAAYSPFIAFDLERYLIIPKSSILIIYIIVLLLIMLKFYDITRFEHVALALFTSLAVPASLTTLIQLPLLCDENPQLFQRSQAVFMLLCAMYCAWLSDTFAYFIGSKFGKHKLCPKISPKKSVEGAIGGIVGEIILNLLLLFVFNKFFFKGESFLSYPFVCVLSIVLSVISMFGDLAASTIKRNFGIKDFGKILPGHGGIMDRFDSVLFVMPVLYSALYIMSLI